MLKLNEMQNIGKAKYVVNFFTGKTHKDGSEFYDIATFSNRKTKDRFVKDLRNKDSQGFPELQTKLMEAIPALTPEDFAYHASDLYVVATPEVRAWLDGNHYYAERYRTFTSQPGSDWNGQGRLCFEIAFAGYWPSQAVATGKGSY